MPLPNLLIIGAQKSGTTALYTALARHPQVFMSIIKEPWFFALQSKSSPYGGPNAARYNSIFYTDMAAYQTLFANAGAARYRGEASTAYLMADCVEAAAENIHRAIPDVKIIAILRQPADRIYSAFCYLRMLQFEPEEDFARALIAENSAARADWPPDFRYRRNGEYAKLLAPYLARFDRAQMRVYLHDEFLAQPEAMLQDLFGWLEIDETIQSDMQERVQVTRRTRNEMFKRLLQKRTGLRSAVGNLIPTAWRQKFINALWTANKTKFPPLSAEMRQTLTEEYRPDILQLQEILDRDLGHWLAPST